MNRSKFIIVTIDGGAASGKSTTAHALAKKLNLLHVDTGMHYRAITRALLDATISPDDQKAIELFLPTMSLETKVRMLSAVISINHKVFADEELRSIEINKTVSKYAAHPAVRNYLLNYQRAQEKIARDKGYHGLVIEGRDIGSVVFPNAQFRFFLYADAATRNERRAAEGQEDSIEERDKLDSKRQAAPLICPSGATVIDASHIPVEIVLERVIKMVSNPH